MHYLNYDMLIKNIKKLMKENEMTQQDLADILEMSQSNVSRALKGISRFTLEQVVNIARHFDTSVDFLVGNQHRKQLGLSPREIGNFISQLMINHKALLSTTKIKEHQFIFNPDYPHGDVTFRNVESNYFSLYFPNYWPIPLYDPNDDKLEEYHQIGNETNNFGLNTFLRQFEEIFKIYEQDGLSEETFNSVLTDLLNHLSEK